MKVTIENKKGLNKDIKVFIDKKTINTFMDDKYDEVKKTVELKQTGLAGIFSATLELTKEGIINIE